jgi:virulence-associated protein VapD
MKQIIISLLAFFWGIAGTQAAGNDKPLSPVTPVQLRCDYVENPLGVDSSPPHLFWQLAGGERGQIQTAYQILVASTAEILAQDKGDLWDSGRVKSDETIHIPYVGKSLKSSQQVFWKVRVWDKSEKISDWSQPASWTMGILSETDWRAKWIASPTNCETLLLRREFTVKPGLRRALVHVCGLGLHELTLNGSKVGEDLLSPGWSKYDKTCLYDTHDITAQLQSGQNAVGLFLGNGMYNVKETGRYTKFVNSFGPLKAIVQLRLEYADGTTDIIGTDGQWRVAPGPITFSSIYGGEDFDARLAEKGWDESGFKMDAKWLPAKIVEGPGGKLAGLSCAAPPLHTFEILKPVSSHVLRTNTTVYDLGQNAAIMLRLEVSGARGDIIKITPSELLKAEGALDQRSTMDGRPVYWQYTLAGDGMESWFPKFFYQGCRYLQVECLPSERDGKPPVLENIEGDVIRSASASAGEFACSNDLFNRIHTLIRWAQRANIVSVLTDCPHRERLGWLEQYHLNGPSLRYEFDLAQLFTKGMNDMADSQLANGLVPDIAPELTVFGGPFRDSPEWGSAFVLVPWQQYQFTGDRELLGRHYDGMKRYVAYLGTKARTNIISYGLGDWYDIGPKPPGPAQLTPNALTATAFYYFDTWILAQTAAMLGKPDEAKQFTAQANDIRAAFNRKFFKATNGSYATGSQCANAIPLVMNLCEPTNRAAVLNALVADVRAHGNAITTGDVGYRYLLRALADGGRSDVIFDMNNQSEKPGYGYQLKMGATSLTEAWDANPADSQNHFMLGQIMEWFYGYLGGIAIDPASPSFKNILIHPQPVGDVTWAKCAYNSIHGRIAVEWKKADGKFSLKLEVPANTTATVYLPTTDIKTVIESSLAVRKAPGVHFLRQGKDRAVFSVGSGTYQFASEWTGQ